jgi:hypothetical protein
MSPNCNLITFSRRTPVHHDNTCRSRNVCPGQAAGAIHDHPTGRFVYVTNRNSGTVDFEGKKVSNGGENNIAVVAIDRLLGSRH